MLGLGEVNKIGRGEVGTYRRNQTQKVLIKSATVDLFPDLSPTKC
jgi:hypothetical protein